MSPCNNWLDMSTLRSSFIVSSLLSILTLLFIQYQVQSTLPLRYFMNASTSLHVGFHCPILMFFTMKVSVDNNTVIFVHPFQKLVLYIVHSRCSGIIFFFKLRQDTENIWKWGKGNVGKLILHLGFPRN